MAIKSYTTEQLKKMKSKTDYEYLAKMTDDDIDYSDCPDIYDRYMAGELVIVENPVLKAIKAEEAKKAKTVEKASPKKSVRLHLDTEIIDAYKSKGRDWQVRINDALRKTLQYGVL
jgi:uncharacterized protein (DUF4415 family)